MPDGAVVAAIVAGDPDGFAEAYDRYAAALYTYCTFMLPSPDDAAAAVRDTFLIAATKLEGLRDPGKLRPWLHAVARNECLRRRSTAGVTSRPPKAPGDGGLPAVPAPRRAARGGAAGLHRQHARRPRESGQRGASGGTVRPGGFPEGDRCARAAVVGPDQAPSRAVAAVATLAAAAVAGGSIAMLTVGRSARCPGLHRRSGGVSGRLRTRAAAGASDLGLRAPGTAGITGSGPADAFGHRAGAHTSPGSPTSRGTAGPSAGSTPSRTAPSPSPSGTSPSPSASPSASASSPPVPGVLRATPDKLVLTSIKGKAVSGTFLLSAVDGPVSDYVIEIPAGRGRAR